MSRLKQTQEQMEAAAKAAFRQEVKVNQLLYDMTQADIARQADMDRSVLSRCLANPDKLTVGRLRKIAQALQLNPLTVLGLIYDRKTVQNLSSH